MDRQATRRGFLAATTLAAAGASGPGRSASSAAAQVEGAGDPADGPRVILVTVDGLRWQEVFRGPEPALVAKLPKPTAGEVRPWTDSLDGPPEARRAALLPFLWGTVAREGFLIGDRDAGSEGRVTNPFHFSYPGYNEILTGSADPRINSNEFGPNPNVTVLEWLHGRPGLAGRVAAFTAWDAFPAILNAPRAGFPVVACWDPIPFADPTPTERTLNTLRASTHRLWSNSAYDSFVLEAALAHLRHRRPRVLYVSFGDTDELAHEGKYGAYLTAAREFDTALARLWAAAQELPGGRGNTTMVITTDHGRGGGPEDWRHHSRTIPGADAIWAAAIGPGPRPPAPAGPFTQSQVAATVAAAVGEDYRAAVPGAAPSLLPIRRPGGRGAS
jgi:hypothetical protein